MTEDGNGDGYEGSGEEPEYPVANNVSMRFGLIQMGITSKDMSTKEMLKEIRRLFVFIADVANKMNLPKTGEGDDYT